MDVLRRTTLLNSLEHELAFDTKRLHLTGEARVKWVVGMLAEYVERWIGTCSPPIGGMHEMVQDSGFAMIEIGSGVLSRELATVDAPRDVIRAWLRFMACLNEVRSRADHRLLPDLSAAISEMSSEVRRWLP
jgi:hypothetical protein